VGGDGVKFLIDLDSRTGGAAAADTALSRVEDAAGRADRHLQDMGGHARGLTQDVFKAEFAMKALEKGAEMAWDGVKKVGELIKDTVAVAGEERREKMALTNLLGGTEEAEKALHYMERFSDLSEFGEKNTKAWGIELLNSGYSGQKWKDAMAAVADAASMAPNKIEGAQEAIASLTRMQLTEKIDARTLRGLRLNVKDVVKDLGDALGMSEKAVKKGLMEGSIPAARAYETVLEALERKTGRRLGEAGLKAGKGLDAKLTHLKELPDKIMKAVAESPAMDKIERAFDRALEAFDPNGPKGAKMVEGLDRLMVAVGDFLEDTNWGEVALEVGSVATSIGKWIDPLSKVVGWVEKLAAGLAALPTFGSDIGDYLARKLHPELGGGDAEFFGKGSQLHQEATAHQAREQARFADTNEQAWREVEDELAAERKRKRMPPALRARNEAAWSGVEGRFAAAQAADAGGGAPRISGKADVVVNVSGSAAASPESIKHAAKAGVHAGMTTALEQQALHAGTRKARRTR